MTWMLHIHGSIACHSDATTPQETWQSMTYYLCHKTWKSSLFAIYDARVRKFICHQWGVANHVRWEKHFLVINLVMILYRELVLLFKRTCKSLWRLNNAINLWLLWRREYATHTSPHRRRAATGQGDQSRSRGPRPSRRHLLIPAGGGAVSIGMWCRSGFLESVQPLKSATIHPMKYSPTIFQKWACIWLSPKSWMMFFLMKIADWCWYRL